MKSEIPLRTIYLAADLQSKEADKCSPLTVIPVGSTYPYLSLPEQALYSGLVTSLQSFHKSSSFPDGATNRRMGRYD